VSQLQLPILFAFFGRVRPKILVRARQNAERLFVPVSFLTEFREDRIAALRGAAARERERQLLPYFHVGGIAL